MTAARLVSVGNVIVDIMIALPTLPERGADVLGSALGTAPGGSFNTMVAAVRQGLPAAYGGAHGTGVFGELVRTELTASGIAVLGGPAPDLDTGYDIALVDSEGERTFVTAFGAEARLNRESLANVHIEASDVIHVSGYGLLESSNAAVLTEWLGNLPTGPLVLVDPGPLVEDIPETAWDVVAARADWLSLNEREALILSGELGARAACATLATRFRAVVVRVGEQGCLVGMGETVLEVLGFPVAPVDTNGAGDAHVGAFLASLASGKTAIEAATRANACAALSVQRRGPSTSPSGAEVDSFLAARAES
jgi:sugar/nucleoside kinase (ribokinase family)